VVYADTARTFPTVRAYQEKYYLGPERKPAAADSEPCADDVHAGSYVVA
jgi:hypothetical protein